VSDGPGVGPVADPKVRRALIEDGLPHLRAQLAASPQIRFVLCNGRQVIDQVLAADLAELHEEGVIGNGPVTCRLYAGAGIGGGRTRWLGWSANLQSGRGVSASLKHVLADWLGQQARGDSTAGPAPGWYAYLTRPGTARTADLTRGGAMFFVQFPCPGAEHNPPGPPWPV